MLLSRLQVIEEGGLHGLQAEAQRLPPVNVDEAVLRIVLPLLPGTHVVVCQTMLAAAPHRLQNASLRPAMCRCLIQSTSSVRILANA